MKTIAILYTSTGPLVQRMKGLVKQQYPDSRCLNLADDSLIADVKANGGLTPNLSRRMLLHVQSLVEAGADVVVSACSSVGAAAETAAALFDIPVVRIDEAMIRKAITTGSRIGVLASLATTMQPTCDYIERIARQSGKPVTVSGCVAQGAYEALSGGDAARHDALLLQAADELAKQVDVLLLAQGSMTEMEQALAQKTGIPVFSSPALCVESLKNYL